MDAIELTLFVKRINALCEEMGSILMRTAFSPNIKDRLDFSCAIFAANGELCAQAAHIPVHLGSMAYAMEDIVARIDWQPGDMLILNDPYLGGTHLPDITLVAPVFNAGQLCAFVANRAHHADIGADTPGSMPLSITLQDEGVVISPTLIMRNNKILDEELNQILIRLNNPGIARPDFIAQISANLVGIKRMSELIQFMSRANFQRALQAMDNYAETLTDSELKSLPAGNYEYTDVMDDDGFGTTDIMIKATIKISADNILVDFTGSAEQVKGNVNCPLSVAAAAVYYCFYCLLPSQTPACAGTFRKINILAPVGSLLNARPPAAVAAGNVETSTRIVDVVLGALAKALPEKIPAASHGSMNNIAMGSGHWDYYETIGGGMGAGILHAGQSAVQTHMTNTLNTPVEILEKYYPLRISHYAVRNNSGGKGRHSGGDGLIREYEFLQDCQVTLLTERRTYAPWGLAGGCPGKTGINKLNNAELPAKASLHVRPHDKLAIYTAGGGGWGNLT